MWLLCFNLFCPTLFHFAALCAFVLLLSAHLLCFLWSPAIVELKGELCLWPTLVENPKHCYKPGVSVCECVCVSVSQVTERGPESLVVWSWNEEGGRAPRQREASGRQIAEGWGEGDRVQRDGRVSGIRPHEKRALLKGVWRSRAALSHIGRGGGEKLFRARALIETARCAV